MSCSPFDLRDYHLKELTDPEQRLVEAHVHECRDCRQELERLRLTQAALFSLRDEEIPKRIAFVSDPIFEPSRGQRWWAAFWGSPARLGFAGAAMLSAAILFSVANRPSTTVSGMSTVEVDQRIQQAVTASETRQSQKTTQLVHDLVDRVDKERDLRLLAENEADYAKKQNYAMVRDTQYMMPTSAGGPK